MDTIKNNLKLAWRSFKKDNRYSWIKIGSMAIGIAACLLITLFVKYELTYDRHYLKTDQIYRLVKEYKKKGAIHKSVYMPAALAKAIKNDLPEIEMAGRISNIKVFGAGSNQIRRADRSDSSFEKGIVFVDQESLKILEAQFIHGNPETSLNQVNSMVITESRAEKLFPNENPLGKAVFINNDIKRSYLITGVIKDFPKHSHLNYHFFITLQNIFINFPEKKEQNSWSGNRYLTYCLVKKGTDINALEKKLENTISKYSKNVKRKKHYRLQPINNIYLNKAQIQDELPHGDIQFIWIFSGIAVCILILACINFINLFVARSGNRAREVGLRKIVGAQSNSIFFQFISESVFYCFISVILGVLLAALSLPYFNNLFSKSLTMPWKEWWGLPVMLLISITIGTIAGLYPSLSLSKTKSAKAIKGDSNPSGKKTGVFSSLVILQFTVSIILVICATTVYLQMDFIVSKNLGFNKNNVLVLRGTEALGKRITPFKNELLKIPDVKSVSASSFLPIEKTGRNSDGFWSGQKRDIPGVVSQIWTVDHDYIRTLGMNITEGRNFSREFSDNNTAIINQSMAEKLQLKAPLGTDIVNYNGHRWTIVGVVEDFNFESLKVNIGPLFMVLGNSSQIITIRLNSSSIRDTLTSIEQIWNQFSPNQSIRYSFMDQEFESMYKDTEKTGIILLNFTLLAFFIACLGLFALTELSIKKRIKEIGIRKVCGVQVAEIIIMLNKDFMKWVAAAFIIACPVAYYAMSKWLENFAYKTSINVWIFVLAGGLAFGIALLTVSRQSLRAATKNPVEALKHDSQ